MVKFYEALAIIRLDFFTFYPTVDQKTAEKKHSASFRNHYFKQTYHFR